jgi:hypothetical protein
VKSPITHKKEAKSPKQQNLQLLQSDLKSALDELEAHILQSSEAINDRLEDVHR